jgi:signal transduction histidine kinase
MLEVRVRDNGPGVPDSEVNRIFEPYIQPRKKDRAWAWPL